MTKKVEIELDVKTFLEGLPLIRGRVVQEVRGENSNLRGVLICSVPLDDHLWLILDRSFEPDDQLVRYYLEELRFIKNDNLERLRTTHMAKRVFQGEVVHQEIKEEDGSVRGVIIRSARLAVKRE